MITNNIAKAAPLIWQEIEKAENILLHCHVNPDADSIGSALATRELLFNHSKNVTVIKGDSDLPAWVKLLPGGDKIELKNYFEIDRASFDLFIAQDSSDVKCISQLQEVVFPAHWRVINIDHHVSNTNFGQINLVATDRPATAQILCELYQEWGVELTPTMAHCLMAGIHADTGGFIHRGTNQLTFAAAAKLAALAPDFTDTLNAIYGTVSLARIKFVGQMLSRLELFLDGRVAMAVLPYEDFVKLNFDNKQEIKQTGLSSMIRNIEGVVVSLVLVEDEPGVTGVSARSRDGEKYDVAKFLGQFGGGGHKAAAGAHPPKPAAAVQQDLLAALTQLLP